MLEIEIKAFCDNHEEIINKIISLGGNLYAKLHEKDIYFKHPSRDFRKTDEAFRVRIENERTLLTYKGPRIGGKTKTRVEHEIEFDDLNSMLDILNSLGFEIAYEIIKNRIIYKIKDIDICIDKVEGIGNFVELEKRGNDREQTERELFGIAENLGLTRFERKSYLELKLEKQSIDN